MQAENEEVAKMIRGGSKDLEASLKDQNLSLAKFEVTVSDSSSVASTGTVRSSTPRGPCTVTAVTVPGAGVRDVPFTSALLPR